MKGRNAWMDMIKLEISRKIVINLLNCTIKIVSEMEGRGWYEKE